MEKIVLLGFGGHALSVIDSINKAGIYQIYGYTDLKDYDSHYPYLGNDASLQEIYNRGIRNAVLGMGFMGDSKLRDRLVVEAKRIGFSFPMIVDPTAVISIHANIGEGSFVGKNAVINSGAKIGRFCIVNTGSIIEHNDSIRDYVHIAVGAVLCGDVVIGNHAMIGAGAVVVQGVTIGANTIVGAGAVVNHDLPANCTAVGVPAKVIREHKGEGD